MRAELRSFLGVATLCITLCSCSQDAQGPGRRAPPPVPPGAAAVPLSTHIVVDQFGYRPGDPKVAVIRTPETGFDAADKFSPGPIYDVRRADDGKIVFSGVPAAWSDGRVELSSGDKGWWLDFSLLSAPGEYFVADAERHVRSATFRIGEHVYKDVLKAAVRMYFYQRAGFRKQTPYAELCWNDEPAYLGEHQDAEARDITDKDNESKVRDLSGGWFDAGDTNKYVTFAAPAVHQLLTAYEQNPEAFTDDFNIPESGNGVPDLLDEVKWETDWLKKMQYADGSSALKVGATVYKRASPPSSDVSPRFYVPSCTSATIAAAGMFAHASFVYGKIPPLRGDAAELQTRAKAAWRNFSQKPHELHCDSNIVHAGNADWDAVDQDSGAVVAAVYLFALTADVQYSDFVKAHYHVLRPYRDSGWSRYNAEQGDALLFYTALPFADRELKEAILADKRANVAAANGVYGFNPEADLYRSLVHDEQYHWGSNQIRANYGNTNLDLLSYDVGVGDRATFGQRALETLHYFHGVNPFGMVYLTNMYAYGATKSSNEVFHTWFGRYSDGFGSKVGTIKRKLRLDKVGWIDRSLDFTSKWNDARSSECGPAPGYLPGGPNRDAVANGVPATLMPPAGQPPQKSFKDWNVDWPDASWAVSEPGIYYQAAYVKLLSAFAR